MTLARMAISKRINRSRIKYRFFDGPKIKLERHWTVTIASFSL